MWMVVWQELVWEVDRRKVYHLKLVCLHGKPQTYESACMQLTVEGHTPQVVHIVLALIQGKLTRGALTEIF